MIHAPAAVWYTRLVRSDPGIDGRLARLRAWVAISLSIGGAIIAASAWAWGQAEASARASSAEESQDRRIRALESDLESLSTRTTKALERQELRLRDLGALQLEQGTDARRLLLEALPTRSRKRLGAKSAELKAAEQRVRRN